MKLKMNCGCIYSTRNKRYEKYCPRHLRIVSANAMAQHIKLRAAAIIQQQTLEQEQKSKNFRIKPLFENDKRYFKKLF